MSAPLQHARPAWGVVAAFALVLASVGYAGVVRLSGAEIREPDAPPVVERSLRFVDESDGSIAVVDAGAAAQGHLVARITGENGFVRGTLRGLARERKRQGLGSDAPFRLVGRADGRLTLIDDVTGGRVDLDSFGATNRGAFARYLERS